MRVLALLLCLTAFGCGDDTFAPPPTPDLYKHPYDFSLAPDGGVDFAVPDLGELDLAKKHPDLLTPVDQGNEPRG